MLFTVPMTEVREVLFTLSLTTVREVGEVLFTLLLTEVIEMREVLFILLLTEVREVGEVLFTLSRTTVREVGVVLFILPLTEVREVGVSGGVILITHDQCLRTMPEYDCNSYYNLMNCLGINCLATIPNDSGSLIEFTYIRKHRQQIVYFVYSRRVSLLLL